ncbi:hypothetical protein HU200_006301 [Digitaria exilis]|uniref:Uncharacterized protein n=1 Tax=Digitaria exilis TaxID=1010633 RepID=A0A835FPC3_9POAL|nr:hypothetical protein HU200_006301 [Digitaria exilis]
MAIPIDHRLVCIHGLRCLKSRIYTNTPLLAQSNRGIEIVICNDAQIITSGPLASLRVEIVALESNHSCKGAWTEEDFDCQIRKSRDGQGSVLDGECLVELVSGRASLGNIHFKERSTWARSREFVLAARVCRSDNVGGPRVEEAFMHPPVMVLVERSKANEKTSHPKLNDRVHDWKGTARHGAYDKRLEKENIHTVQDFLKALNKDSDKLCQILEIKSKKRSSWEAVVRHARECDLGDNHELKSYKVEMENVKLFFNCIDDLVGAEFHDCFIAKDKFGERQKVTCAEQFCSVENLSLCGCGADRAPDNSLGDANRNAAEQSAPAPSPQGSEGTNDELGFRFDELGITPSDVLDESIHGIPLKCSVYEQVQINAVWYDPLYSYL